MNLSGFISYFANVFKISGYIKITLLEFISAACIFVVSLILFSFIADEIVIEKDNQFDLSIYRYVASYESAFNTKAALFITNFGSDLFLIPAFLIIILVCIKTGKKLQAIVTAVVAVVSFLSGLLFKDIFQRTRPSVPLISGTSGYSFPSGHSLGGFTFSGVLIYLIWKTSLNKFIKWMLSVFLIFFSCMIGLSRIYLNVHYASDVLGSLLLTMVWLSLTFILVKTIERRRNQLE